MGKRLNVLGGFSSRQAGVVIAATLWVSVAFGQNVDGTALERQAIAIEPPVSALILSAHAIGQDVQVTLMGQSSSASEESLELVLRDLNGTPVSSVGLGTIPDELKSFKIKKALAAISNWGPGFSLAIETSWGGVRSEPRHFLAQHRCDQSSCGYYLLAGKFDGAVVVSPLLDQALQEFEAGHLRERVQQISAAYPYLAQESELLIGQVDQFYNQDSLSSLGPGKDCIYAWQVVVGPESKLATFHEQIGPGYTDGYGRSWAFSEQGGAEFGLAHCVSGQAVGHPLSPPTVYDEEYAFDGYLEVQMDLRLLSGASCAQTCASSVNYSVMAAAMIEAAVDVLDGSGTANAVAEEGFELFVGGTSVFVEEVAASVSATSGSSDSDLGDLLRNYAATIDSPLDLRLEGSGSFAIAVTDEGHAFAEVGNGYQVTAVGYPACGSPSANVILESADFATLLDWNTRGGGIKIDRWERGP